MKISIIIPVYNCKKHLPNLLDSILGQTYQNFEIIMIDDGSQDGSGSVCDTYAERDGRIQVRHQENHGVSHARNVGLSLATGYVVSFIDSDDILEPNMYELLVSVMQEHDADISHCGYKRIVGERILLVHDTKRIISQNSQEALECLVGGRVFGGGLWNKLFRRDLLKDLRFREELKINEDILFNFEAMSLAKRIVFADYALYNYIAHMETSAVFNTPDEKKCVDSCTVYRHIYEKLSGTELNDVAAERYIHTLSVYYKFCMKNRPSACAEIAAHMHAVAEKTKHLGRNMTVTVKLTRYCPWLYRIVNGIYHKVRKPYWEPRKD